ncbi:hypothetical protein [Bradyrhizobium commune]|uniref:Uncharacterized protein n=1 Tax=Bradyrhizobium commune TaxID=83627 RepID=A0A7S9H2V4_9BRAD|nr:hypothetical protein [Bradyrhizobium commune]QPF95445.1 hypothetical protein IC761_10085 [Bradyrhizobium commune]
MRDFNDLRFFAAVVLKRDQSPRRPDSRSVDVAIRVRERLDTDADMQVKWIGVSRRILVASPSLLAKVGAAREGRTNVPHCAA